MKIKPNGIPHLTWSASRRVFGICCWKFSENSSQSLRKYSTQFSGENFNFIAICIIVFYGFVWVCVSACWIFVFFCVISKIDRIEKRLFTYICYKRRPVVFICKTPSNFNSFEFPNEKFSWILRVYKSKFSHNVSGQINIKIDELHTVNRLFFAFVFVVGTAIGRVTVLVKTKVRAYQQIAKCKTFLNMNITHYPFYFQITNAVFFAVHSG